MEETRKLALAASIKAIAFIGTNGLDGPTNPARAIVEGHAIDRAVRNGLGRGYPFRNDSNGSSENSVTL